MGGAAGLDLVTGGAGFIGSHLVEALLAAGRRVRVVDDLTTGRRENLEAAAAGGGLEFLEGDLADPAVARAAVAGAERAFHLAARPSVPWSVAHPEEARRANHETTLALLEAAQETGLRRIVFSSSSAVYGPGPALPKEESMAPEPASPYAEHKLLGEGALAAAAAAGGPTAVALRYFNVYGPRQDPGSPYSGVISIFFERALAGEAPILYGDGGQTRDFVFVEDVVRANLLAAGAEPGPSGFGAVNVGTGRAVSIRELWDEVCAALGVPAPEPERRPERPGDVRHSRAAVGAARRLLGFAAQVPLEEGLRRTAAFLRGPGRRS